MSVFGVEIAKNIVKRGASKMRHAISPYQVSMNAQQVWILCLKKILFSAKHSLSRLLLAMPGTTDETQNNIDASVTHSKKTG